MKAIVKVPIEAEEEHLFNYAIDRVCGVVREECETLANGKDIKISVEKVIIRME